MLVQLLVDNPISWVLPYAERLVNEINSIDRYVPELIYKHNAIKEGEILVLLSCERILKKLSLNKHNLIVHESALPEGKGWAPLTWQILEGKNEIPITLFEASEKVDAGAIYYQDIIKLEGNELNPEIRHLQGRKTIELILRFLNEYPDVKGIEQDNSKETFYSKRTPEDSELDIDKTIREQFNVLRVCDNQRYPAYFVKGGYKYILKIEKTE